MGFTSPSPGPRRINRSGSTFVGRRPYLVGGSDEGSRTDGEQPIAVLEQLLTDKGEQLLRTAILLAGSRSDGEDPLQNAHPLAGPSAKSAIHPKTGTTASVPALPTSVPTSAARVTYSIRPVAADVTVIDVLAKAATAVGSQAKPGTGWPAGGEHAEGSAQQRVRNRAVRLSC